MQRTRGAKGLVPVSSQCLQIIAQRKWETRESRERCHWKGGLWSGCKVLGTNSKSGLEF